MNTKPCKLTDPVKVQEIVKAYFEEREKEQEVRELKNGDKRVYRTPPSLWGLAAKLGVTYQCLWEYLNENNEKYNKEIIDILKYAKERIINELYDGVQLGYWNEKVSFAQLQKYGVLGESEDKTVHVVIQGSNSWSE